MSAPQPGARATYRVESTDDGMVVHVFNEIDIANANMLGESLLRIVETRPRRPVVVDLSYLVYIDSVGLHILLRAFQHAERVGTEAVLVAAGQIRQLVEQVGLDRIVRVLPDVPSAFKALKTKSPSAAEPP
jgi:anti-anti-sigma factor